jgi:hypothetical protein
MRRRGFVDPELVPVVFLGVAAAAVVCFVAIFDSPLAHSTDGSRYMRTVEYEGHAFVVSRWRSRGAIVHHPDCKCWRAEK